MRGSRFLGGIVSRIHLPHRPVSWMVTGATTEE